MVGAPLNSVFTCAELDVPPLTLYLQVVGIVRMCVRHYPYGQVNQDAFLQGSSIRKKKQSQELC